MPDHRNKAATRQRATSSTLLSVVSSIGRLPCLARFQSSRSACALVRHTTHRTRLKFETSQRGNAEMTWRPEMDELRRRQEMTRRMGGADKVKLQHDGGRLTVRERIDRLLDKGSFRELGTIAGKAEYDGRNDLVDLTPANAVMGR